LWSADASEEAVFERVGFGGTPTHAEADRTFHLAVQNRTATKLDYYVRPQVRMNVYISDLGTAVIRTTVVVKNTTPSGSRPSYMLGPTPATDSPGDYIGWVLLWGPHGATQLNGTPESGLQVTQSFVTARAGEQPEYTFETVITQAIRNGRFDLRLVPQPRIEPMNLEVRVNAPGWVSRNAATWTGSLDRTRTLRWPLHRADGDIKVAAGMH
jgi:hypothetical protein